AALLARAHLRHLARIADYLKALAAGDGSAVIKAPPAPRSAAAVLAPELGEAIAEAGRAWSERRRELEAVVTANETIFASLPDPLIMLDDQRRVVRANRAADSLFGEPAAGRELMALMRAPAADRAGRPGAHRAQRRRYPPAQGRRQGHEPGGRRGSAGRPRRPARCAAAGGGRRRRAGAARPEPGRQRDQIWPRRLGGADR